MTAKAIMKLIYMKIAMKTKTYAWKEIYTVTELSKATNGIHNEDNEGNYDNKIHDDDKDGESDSEYENNIHNDDDDSKSDSECENDMHKNDNEEESVSECENDIHEDEYNPSTFGDDIEVEYSEHGQEDPPNILLMFSHKSRSPFELPHPSLVHERIPAVLFW